MEVVKKLFRTDRTHNVDVMKTLDTLAQIALVSFVVSVLINTYQYLY